MMQKIISVMLAVLMLLCMLTSCSKKWTCDVCGKTWRGKAYYMAYGGPDSTLCEDCAWQYYNPFPYENFAKN